MAKKNFSKGIDAFFSGNTKETSKQKKQTDEISEKPEKRATFIIETDLLEKMKALAYWERKTAKTILKQSLEHYFSSKGDKYLNEALKNYRSDQKVQSK